MQSDQLKQHMVTIRFDQLLSSCEMYEHGCLEIINKLYKSTGKYNDKLQFKAIIEVSMVSNNERCTNNSTMLPGPTMIIGNPSARK